MLLSVLGLLSTGAIAGPATAAPVAETATTPAMLRLAAGQSMARDVGPEYHLDADGHGANPRHDLAFAFTPRGVHFDGRDGGFALRLERFGRGAGAPVRYATPRIDGAWVEYDRGAGLSEWFVNLPQGLEQGWTVTERPAGRGPLMLELNTTRPPDRAEHSRLAWSGSIYHGLAATDARGRELPSRWFHDGARLRIEVDDRTAIYPILIDPWLQQAKLTATDGTEANFLGFSVAISGDTALVGAPTTTIDDNRAGAAYVFTRSDGAWTEQAKLVSDNAHGVNPQFGYAVAISEDTAMVGAGFLDVDGTANQGMVYVFTRTDGVWSEQAELTADDAAAEDWFGHSVALSGDTALIGAPRDANELGPGAVYVFTRADDVWTQQNKLAATGDVWYPDMFGVSVALSDDVALIGAWFADELRGAAYVFTRDEDGWNEQAKLTASDAVPGHALGNSVALSGDTAVVAARNAGAAYVFTRSNDSWNEQAKLTCSDCPENPIWSVALSGDTAVLGAPDVDVGDTDTFEGAAYVFTRSGSDWAEQVKLTAADAAAGDRFGAAVALAGDTILTGATGPPPGIFLESPAPSSTQALRPGGAYAFIAPGATIGTIEGTVQSLYCGAASGPLRDATVEITGTQGTYIVQTGESGFPSGFYRTFLPDDESPLDISVTAPGHLTATVEDVSFNGGDIVVLDFDLLLEAPCAVTDPPSLSAAIDPDQTTNETLTISNVDGATALSWEVGTAQPPTTESQTTDSRGVSDIATHSADDPIGPDTQVAQDLAFRLDAPLPGLRPVHPTGGVAACDGEPGIIVHDDGTIESGYGANPDTVSQVMFADRFTPTEYPTSFLAVCVSFISLGPPTLDFEIVVFDDDGPGGGPGTELGALPVTAEDIPVLTAPLPPDYEPTWFRYDISPLDVSIDSGSLFIGVRWAPSDPNIVITVDTSDGNPVGFADGYWWNSATHSWEPIEDAFDGDYRSLFLRAVESRRGCLEPSSVAWLEVSPGAGLTSAGDSDDVQVSFDSTGLITGEYRASICVETNDPVNSLLVVPVQLTVTVPPDFTTIEGAVGGLGYCGANPGSIGDVTVIIDSQEQTYTVLPEENGFYQLGLDPAEGPVNITVSAPGHLPQTVTDIELMPGENVTQDFDLALEEPCVTVDPKELLLTLPEGGSVELGLTVGNIDGDTTLDWTIETAEPPAVTSLGADRGVDFARSTPADLATAHDDGAKNVMTPAPVHGELQLPSVRPSTPAGGVVDCATEPGLIFHDDGTIESGYYGLPAYQLVDRFTPGSYPAAFHAVCLAWLSGGDSPTTQDFEVVVFDDDGPGGGPGTELGAMTGTATDVPPWPPEHPVWVAVDISSLDITIDSGSIYVGARWTPAPGPVALSVDESPSHPPGFAGGYRRHDDADPWSRIVDTHGEYRSLFVRVAHSAPGCDDPGTIPWLSAAPAAGNTPAGETTQIQVTVDTADLEPGVHRASLCIATNDEAMPLVPVPVTLTVTAIPAPELSFLPESLDFGEVEVGPTGEPRTATLHNTGTLEAAGLAFDLPEGAFVADTSACGNALPAGESCPIELIFTPTDAGPATASLGVTSAEEVSAFLPLSGYGVGEPAFTPTALAVDPSELLSDGNGVFEPNEQVEVVPTWRNDGNVNASVAGTASDFTGMDGAIYSLAEDQADYGLVEPAATASCQATGLCYRLGVNNPTVRPATHWMATFDETLTDDDAKTWSLHIGDSFADVPRESLFYRSVETLLHHGVTGGCTDGEFCASGTNTRAQMAVFLLKAGEGGDYLPPACVEGEERFLDVSAGSTFCPWIEELAARDVTSGCGGGNYCPGDSVTRAQMAVFLLKALEGGGYSPPGCTSTYTDVTCPSPFGDWIEELGARGITGGCSADPPAYCPSAPVTRAQMAVFISKTFGLTLYGP